MRVRYSSILELLVGCKSEMSCRNKKLIGIACFFKYMTVVKVFHTEDAKSNVDLKTNKGF